MGSEVHDPPSPGYANQKGIAAPLTDILVQIGVDLSKFPPAQTTILTVYRANFRDPSSYFFAQQFAMRHRDVLYVSNAESVEVMKFLNYVGSVTTIAGSIPQSAAAARHGAEYVGRGSAPGL